MGKKDEIVITRKMMLAIAPMAAIIGLLLSKHEPGPLILFIIGIGLGVYLGKAQGK